MRAYLARRRLRVGRNLVRNTDLAGVIAGTPGTAPRGWNTFFPDVAKGITSQIVGTGYEDGLHWVDWSLSGTATTGASGSSNIFFTPFPTPMHLRQGTPTTLSVFCRLSGGSLTGLSFLGVAVNELDASGTFLTNGFGSITPTTSPSLRRQRQVIRYKTANASCAQVEPNISIGYAVGTAISLTLRIAHPQFEIGWTATEPERRPVVA